MKRLLLGLALVSAAFAPTGVDAAPDARSYVAGNYRITIDGNEGGFVKLVDDLGYTRLDDGKLLTKGVPMTATIHLGFNTKRPLDWVAGALAGNAASDVVVVAHDYKLDAQEQYALPDFTIDEIRLPKCDASGKESSYLRVRGRPSSVTRSSAEGKAPAASGKVGNKLWLPSNFRVTIAGIDTSKVAVVGPLDLTRGPQGFAVAPFEVRVAGPTTDTWMQWAEKTLVRGEADERTMKLELLGGDRVAVLATFELSGATPVWVSYAESDVSAQAPESKVFKLVAKSVRMVVPKSGKKPAKG